MYSNKKCVNLYISEYIVEKELVLQKFNKKRNIQNVAKLITDMKMEKGERNKIIYILIKINIFLYDVY